MPQQRFHTSYASHVNIFRQSWEHRCVSLIMAPLHLVTWWVQYRCYTKFCHHFIGQLMTFFFLRRVHLCPQQEPKMGLLYVNICSWKRVPAPQDPSKPLPLCAGKLETDTNKDQGKRLSCAALQATGLAFVLYDKNKKTNKLCVSSFCRPVHCVRCSNEPCSATGK